MNSPFYDPGNDVHDNNKVSLLLLLWVAKKRQANFIFGFCSTFFRK